MDKFIELGTDIAELWGESYMRYLTGAWNTILLALVCTLIGCIIGLGCGILQTIPTSKNDNPIKRVLLLILRGIIRVYVEVFRGTPMILQAHRAASTVLISIRAQMTATPMQVILTLILQTLTK